MPAAPDAERKDGEVRAATAGLRLTLACSVIAPRDGRRGVQELLDEAALDRQAKAREKAIVNRRTFPLGLCQVDFPPRNSLFNPLWRADAPKKLDGRIGPDGREIARKPLKTLRRDPR